MRSLAMLSLELLCIVTGLGGDEGRHYIDVMSRRHDDISKRVIASRYMAVTAK